MDATDNANTSFVKRKRLSEKSKTVYLYGRLHSDLFFQAKLLLNGIGLRLKLVHNKDSFTLLSRARDAVFKVSITKAVLRAKKVRVCSCVAGSRENAKAFEQQISDRESRVQNVFRACVQSVNESRTHFSSTITRSSRCRINRSRCVQRYLF